MRGGGSRRRFSIRDCSRSAETTRSDALLPAGRLVNRRSPVFLSRCLPGSRTQQFFCIVVLLAVVLVLAGCRRSANADRPGSPTPSRSAVPQAEQNQWFTDRAAETGLDFVYFNG